MKARMGQPLGATGGLSTRVLFARRRPKHGWTSHPWHDLPLTPALSRKGSGGRSYSGSLKSAIHNWLEPSLERPLVHINCLPSGENTGSTSPEG